MKRKEDVIKDIFDFNRWMYSLTGFGRVDFPGKFQRIFYITYKTFSYISFIIHLSFLYHEIVAFADNLAMLSFTVSFGLFASVGLCKAVIMNWRRNEVEDVKRRLEANFGLAWVGHEDWEKEVKAKHSDMILTVNKVVYSMVAVGALITFLLPLVTNSKQKFFLPFPFTYLAKTKYYAPIYAYHAFSVSMFLINFVSNDMIFVGLIIRLCENLEIVETGLKEFTIFYDFGKVNGTLEDKRKTLIVKDVKVNINMKRVIRERNRTFMKRYIIHHQAALRELKILTKIYSFPVVLHFIFGPLLCGFLAYVIFSDLGENEIIIQQISYGLPAGLYLLLFCYFGTYVSDKFNDVRFAFYSSPWYDFDAETKKLINIVLLGLGKSGTFRVGKIFDMALTTYLSLVKTAYNFVTLLRNTS